MSSILISMERGTKSRHTGDDADDVDLHDQEPALAALLALQRRDRRVFPAPAGARGVRRALFHDTDGDYFRRNVVARVGDEGDADEEYEWIPYQRPPGPRRLRRGATAKWVDDIYELNPLAVAGSYLANSVGDIALAAVSQGDDYWQRIGNRITIRRIAISGYVGFRSDGDIADTDFVRLVLVRDNQARFASLAYPAKTLIFGNPSSVVSGIAEHRNLTESSRFDILFDRIIGSGPYALPPNVLVTQSGVVGDPIVSTLQSVASSCEKWVRETIECEIPITFTSSGSGDGEIGSAAVYLLAYHWSTSTISIPTKRHAVAHLHVRTTFDDC